MQFITAAILLAAASLSTAQSVPASAPGCVKYCLRIAREQAPSACTWAGWCQLSGFQDSVSNCYTQTCGAANQQTGAQIYQQICSSAGTNTVCPTSGASTASSVVSSASSVAASATSSAASVTSSTSDLITTTIGGVATTFPASFSSSIGAALSSSAAGASSSAASVTSSRNSAASTATAPISSAISSLLSSASVVASSVASAGASATQSSNAAVALGLPSYAQVASIGTLLLGVAAGALML